MIWEFRLIGLLLGLLLAGCTFKRATSFSIDPTDYLALENGERREYKLVNVAWRASNLGEAYETGVLILSPCKPANLVQAGRLVRHAPPKYLLSPLAKPNLVSIAAGLTYEPSEYPIDRESVRWILSIDPLVVGIGEEREPPNEDAVGGPSIGSFKLFSTCRLVSRKDLDQKVRKIVIMSRWPETWPEYSYGGRTISWEDMLAAYVRPLTREVRMPTGTTISDVIARMDAIGELKK